MTCEIFQLCHFTAYVQSIRSVGNKCTIVADIRLGGRKARVLAYSKYLSWPNLNSTANPLSQPFPAKQIYYDNFLFQTDTLVPTLLKVK